MKTKKIIFIFIAIITIITNCKNINYNKNKKNASKKQHLNILADIDYIKTFNGKLLLKITISFLKTTGYNKIKIKKNDIRKLQVLIEKKQADLLITFPENVSNINKDEYIASPDILSDAFYCIGQKELSKYVSFDDVLKNTNIGFIHESYVETYINNNLRLNGNTFLYYNIENLINDFKKRKLDIILLDRKNYYRYISYIPSKLIYYKNINKPYSKIYFFNKSLYDDFIYYLNSKEDKYEWKSLFISEKIINKINSLRN